MPTVFANQLTVVHKGSMGQVLAMPDVCKTPAPPGPPVPIPYPNVGMSQNLLMGTVKVKVEGQPAATKDSKIMPTTGDEAGVAGGVVSSVIKGEATFTMFSMNVKVEGKQIVRAFDLSLGNKQNTPPVPLMQPTVPVLP